MGLFGDADASQVPNDPFYVAPDTYYCVLTEWNKVEGKNGPGLSWKWVIEEQDSEYVGNSISEWKNIHPEVPESEWTPDIRKDNARTKQRLEQMGVPEEDMNEILDNLDDYIGTYAYVTVVESTDRNDPTKKYTNVRNVRIDE